MWIALVIGWMALVVVGPWLLRNPRENVETGLAWYAIRLYVKVVHRVVVRGVEHVPRERYPGPIVVVANHSAGIDPLLLQSAAPFEIRFLMARDMQPRLLGALWRWAGVISVNREGGDTQAAREAVRFLRSAGEMLEAGYRCSGVVGIFPEGGIERPAEELLPFLPGVGLIVHRSGARVLPAVIRGTPRATTAWGSLLERSRSSVEFLPMIEYGATGMKPAEIAADLQRRFQAHTGWRVAKSAGPATRS
ncbi:MAG: lysophospholipid acyltransferase family protein [Phycisphaerales bacterium]